jgi:hypothetical protein
VLYQIREKVAVNLRKIAAEFAQWMCDFARTVALLDRQILNQSENAV